MTPDELNSLYQIGGAVGILATGGFFGLRWVLRAVAALEKAPIKTEKTSIITGDTIAMERLAGTIEASNVILTENNVLRREEHADRAAMRDALEANTAAIEKATAAFQDLRPELRELTREIVRSAR